MQSKRNIPLLYILTLCNSLIFAYVIERLFWQSRGMTVALVVACEAIYAGVVIALEVPSGVLADRLGRKRMLLFSCISGFAELLILLFAQRFWHFAAAVLIAGIGKAAESGAQNALLYDTLAEQGYSGRFGRTFGRMRALDGIGTIIAALCGSLLAGRFGLALPYQLSLISCALGLLAALLLVEPARSFADEASSSVRDTLRDAAAFFRRRPDVFRIVAQATVIAAFLIYIDEFWQLYLNDIGLSVTLFGVVSALFALARIAGDLLAGRMSTSRHINRRMTALGLLVALALLAAGICRSALGVAALLAGACIAEVMQVIATGHLHHQIDDDARATIESIGSLLERVAVLPLGALFAWMADTQSLFSAYTALAGCCALAMLLFGWLGRHDSACGT